MENKPENKSIKLDPKKLFGRHWVGEIQDYKAASMPSTKPPPVISTSNEKETGHQGVLLAAVKASGQKPQKMPATKIGQEKKAQLHATKISAQKPRVELPATKIGKPQKTG